MFYYNWCYWWTKMSRNHHYIIFLFGNSRKLARITTFLFVLVVVKMLVPMISKLFMNSYKSPYCNNLHTPTLVRSECNDVYRYQSSKKQKLKIKIFPKKVISTNLGLRKLANFIHNYKTVWFQILIILYRSAKHCIE